MVKVRRGVRIRPKKKQLKGDGFFDGLKKLTDLSYIFGTPKTPIIADKPSPAQQATQETTGIPDKAILKTIADNSYKATSDEMAPVPGFTLKEKTPTLVFYQKDGENIIVIGVRGTADFRDFRAWFSTAFSVIPDSQRFKEDLATVTEFQQRFPLSSYTYYATGHSLGGTLIDELIKRGMVKEARTYNPAIETSDIPNVELSKKNKRIYADGDPLYLLQGRYDNPTEVRPSYKYYPSSVMDYVPGYDKYKQHVLANPVFTGGEQEQIDFDKIKWGAFTKQAKAHGYNKDRLEDFADYVIANKDKFKSATEKRAHFYKNIIMKGKGEKEEVEMEPKDYYQEHRNIVSLLSKTGKTLQKEAQDQKKEAIQMAKKLHHPSPFYHMRGAGIMANSQFYRTDPKRLGLKGDGFLDDLKEGFKKGVESRIGKIPEPAVLSPEQQADVRRRQHIQDVDKQREKMVAQKKKIAIDDMMEYAGKENVLKAIYAREGTDNPKDYLARVVEKAKKRAEEFYPY